MTDRDHRPRPIDLLLGLAVLLAGPFLGLAVYGMTDLRPVLLGVGVFILFELLGALIVALSTPRRSAKAGERQRILISVLKSVGEGVIVADKDGKILLANEAARRLGGLSDTDVSPADWALSFGLYSPDARTLCKPEDLPLARALRGEEVRDVEIYVKNDLVDGVWVSVSGSPVRDRDGNITGGTVIFRDITERKTSEESHRQLSNAVEQTADIVFITDVDGVIEYVNPAFESTTGYTREEALGNNPRMLMSGEHENEHFESLWASILQGKIHRSTTINRKKNGELFHAEQCITPIKNAAGQVTHFVAVVKDVTERHKREEQKIEMRLMGKVQRKLYPDEAPHVDGADLAGAVFPAVETCGDYFDYVPLKDGSLGIVIGDVTGHGLGPALVMAEVRAYVRSLARTRSDLCEILNELHQAIAADLEDSYFVAMLLARLDIRSGRLTYVNAGHTPGYVINRKGRVKAEMKSNGLPVGMFEERGYSDSVEIELDPDDVAVFLTDGITESENPDGEPFGSDRVIKVVRKHRRGSALQIVHGLHQAVREFVGDARQRDDNTVVVCKLDSQQLPVRVAIPRLDLPHVSPGRTDRPDWSEISDTGYSFESI